MCANRCDRNANSNDEMTTWPVTWWHNVVDGETDARDASGMMVVTMRRGRWTQVLIGAMIMVTMMR